VRIDRALTPASSWECESRRRLAPYERWSSDATLWSDRAETAPCPQEQRAIAATTGWPLLPCGGRRQATSLAGAWLDEPGLVREDDGVDAVAQVELGE
jgi:hypothetical protein